MVGQSTSVSATRNGTAFTLNHQQLTGTGYDYFYGKSSRSTPTTAGVETIALSLSQTGASSTDTRSVLAAPNNESFSFSGGNLTQDALWSYQYDDEDRLKQVESRFLDMPGVTPVRLTFLYDFLGRRVQKQVSTYSGGTWSVTTTIVYAYDGLNLIAEFRKNGSTLTLDKSYYWGLDRSASLQGAAGIGGFLGMVLHGPSPPAKYAAVNDPWGSVVGLLDLATGVPMAEYEYSPFGEPLRAMGTKAQANPWRFSTKYYDQETGLLNFGWRYYSSSLGRFLNRDPKDDLGRLQLSAPLSGGSVSAWSYIGSLIGVPGKSPSLAPRTSTGLDTSNERQDAGYHNSTQPGNLFAHRKGSAYPWLAPEIPAASGHPTGIRARHPYSLVDNNPYSGNDPLGLDYLDYYGDSTVFSGTFDATGYESTPPTGIENLIGRDWMSFALDTSWTLGGLQPSWWGPSSTPPLTRMANSLVFPDYRGPLYQFSETYRDAINEKALRSMSLAAQGLDFDPAIYQPNEPSALTLILLALPCLGEARLATELVTERYVAADTIAARTASGDFYSVAFETKLNPASYPGVSRAAHFQEANEALLSVMESDPQFAQMMQGTGVNLERTATGLAARTPPGGWTWHHAQDAGVMQLVPSVQHTPGSIFWYTLHPGGQGGYAIWGK